MCKFVLWILITVFFLYMHAYTSLFVNCGLISIYIFIFWWRLCSHSFDCVFYDHAHVKENFFPFTTETESHIIFPSCHTFLLGILGMLPVRWTAPEALKDGIYSAKSDIWSYGVLVFEIVTFGSFPYQGLSNKEVIDYVSKGNQLMLPDKCPNALWVYYLYSSLFGLFVICRAVCLVYSSPCRKIQNQSVH